MQQRDCIVPTTFHEMFGSGPLGDISLPISHKVTLNEDTRVVGPQSTHIICIFQQANERAKGAGRGPSFLPSSFRICISDTRGGKIRAEASLVDGGVRSVRCARLLEATGREELPRKIVSSLPSLSPFAL